MIRKFSRDQGHALVGKSALNRCKLRPVYLVGIDRYKRIVAKESKITEFFVNMFLSSFPKDPEEIISTLMLQTVLCMANKKVGSFTASTFFTLSSVICVLWGSSAIRKATALIH